MKRQTLSKKPGSWFGPPCVFAVLMAMTLLAGCGVLTLRPQDFSNAETGEGGQTYTLDEVEDITENSALTDEEKRDALRELGIEDEDLIDALLGS